MPSSPQPVLTDDLALRLAQDPALRSANPGLERVYQELRKVGGCCGAARRASRGLGGQLRQAILGMGAEGRRRARELLGLGPGVKMTVIYQRAGIPARGEL